MRKVFALLALVAIVQAASANTTLKAWKAFKLKYHKDYRNQEEENLRLQIFAFNLKEIGLHNRQYEKGSVTYKTDVNQYTDLLYPEFQSIRLGFNYTISKELRKKIVKEDISPKKVDWRKSYDVTHIKDQGDCGSSWAFAAVGAVEGLHSQKTGVLVPFSAQNLIDCSSAYGNEGCDGGSIQWAYRYLQDNGLNAEIKYPYNGEFNRCDFDSGDALTIRAYADIPQGDENELAKAVAEIGPVAVGISTWHQSFQFYSEGIYNEPDPSPKSKFVKINHAALVVGYDTDYWLVKNSWGKGWGEKGYFKIARNKKNQLHIASAASYPIL